MQVPFMDLQRQHKLLQNQIQSAFFKTIEKSQFVFGEEVDLFEQEFASYCGKKYAVGVNSGTDALKIALMAYGIKPEDEVITVPNSYIATAMTISSLGARPVFVDIDPRTHTIDISKIEEKISKKTKAIVPVHLFGQPAEMDAIIAIVKKHKLYIIEDACQAHGARYKGKTVPYSETGAFSFYPSKNLGALGDGGAIVTDNREIAKKAKLLRNDGSIKKYVHEIIGIKSRLDTIQADVLRIKLRYLNTWNRKRRKHAHVYNKLLSGVKELTPPLEYEGRYHVYHVYVIETAKRNSLQKYLADHGIQTIIHYPIPIHLQKAYAALGYRKGDFPLTEQKADSTLSLPMFPDLREEEIMYICRVIKTFFKK